MRIVSSHWQILLKVQCLQALVPKKVAATVDTGNHPWLPTSLESQAQAPASCTASTLAGLAADQKLLVAQVCRHLAWHLVWCRPPNWFPVIVTIVACDQCQIQSPHVADDLLYPDADDPTLGDCRKYGARSQSVPCK